MIIIITCTNDQAIRRHIKYGQKIEAFVLLLHPSRPHSYEAGESRVSIVIVNQFRVKFNVKNADGQWEQIYAFVGENFQDAILRMKVKGADSERLCYGADFVYQPHERPHDPFSDGPICGMCRIVLKDNWYDKVNQETEGMTDEEEYLLQKYTDARKDMRLSCCLPVEKWMDGCTFEIYSPPEVSELTDLH